MTQSYPVPPPPARPKKKRRIFLWVFMTIQALFIIWIVAGLTTKAPACTGDALDQRLCHDGQNTGATVAIIAIVLIWVVVDFLVGITYGVYRLSKRT